MFQRLAAAVLAAAVLTACRAGRDAAAGVTDDAGRVVRVDAPPHRIVSLSPATTELLFDLGAGDRVVGRTRWCQDPPEALAVPSVGDGFAPNVEAVVARRPDLVVFYHTASNAEAIAQLDAMGIATISLRTDRIADFERAARLLGTLLDRAARADSLIRALEAELAAAPAASAASAAPSVAIIAWDNPPIVIGASSFLGEIVTLAGARNVFSDVAQPSLTVSIETIVARDPDLLLVHTDDSLPGFMARPEWRVVEAVRERRLLRVHGTEFGHPSFRVAKAVAHLRELLAARE